MSGAHRTLSAERKRRGLVADIALRRGGRRRGAGAAGSGSLADDGGARTGKFMVPMMRWPAA